MLHLQWLRKYYAHFSRSTQCFMLLLLIMKLTLNTCYTVFICFYILYTEYILISSKLLTCNQLLFSITLACGHRGVEVT